MKRLLIVVLINLLAFSVFAEKCYLVVVKSGSQNTEMLTSMGVSFVSKHIQPVQPSPESGFSTKECYYDLSLVETRAGFFVTITGKNFNGFGSSEKMGIKGVEEAIINALVKKKKNDESEVFSPVADIKVNEDEDILKYLPLKKLIEISDFKMYNLRSLSIHPGNKYIGVCLKDRGVVYDFMEDEIKLSTQNTCSSSAFHPGGEIVAFTEKNNLVLYSLKSKKKYNNYNRILSNHMSRSTISFVAFSRAGDFLAWSTTGKTKLLNLKRGKIRTFNNAYDQYSLTFTHNSKGYLTLKDKWAEIVNPKNGILIKKINYNGQRVNYGSISKNNDYVAFRKTFGSGTVYSTKDKNHLTLGRKEYEGLLFHPLINRVLVKIESDRIVYWDIESFAEIKSVATLSKNQFPVLSYDGSTLAATYFVESDQIIVIYKTEQQLE